MATALGGTAHHSYAESRVRQRTALRPHTRSWAISLSMLGLVSLIVAAWGGIIPYVGPIFGYSADGAGSWYWNLQHATLALIPGAVACVAALSFLWPISKERAAGTRVGLSVAGLALIACGAWFVIGPVAWPVLSNGTYFAPASPLMTLANEVGYSLGVGVLLAACGAFALGWAARHNAPLEALGQGGAAMMEKTEARGGMPAGAVPAGPAGAPGVAPAGPGTAPGAVPAEPVAPASQVPPAPATGMSPAAGSGTAGPAREVPPANAPPVGPTPPPPSVPDDPSAP